MSIFSPLSYFAASATMALSLRLFYTLPAQAISIAPLWNFEFSGDITGNGKITLDLQDQDSQTGSYLVAEVEFSLNFGQGNPQSVSLANFPFTQPLRFNPLDTSSELYSTLLDSLVKEWRLGTLDTDGEFPGGGINLSGFPGIGLPPDPPGVGGVIAFTPTASSEIRTGTWTAQPVPVPEPSTLFGTGIVIGFGSSFKRHLSSKKAIKKESS
jgi:hypothetical protein